MTEPTTKKCPACAESVMAEAVKCKHCGEKIIPEHVKTGASRAAAAILFLVLALSYSCFRVIGHVGSKPPADKNVALSIDSWIKHRKLIETRMSQVLKADHAHLSYKLSLELRADSYFSSCEYSGCSEFRYFLRQAEKASEDGKITPKERADVAGTRAYVMGELDRAEKEVRSQARSSK